MTWLSAITVAFNYLCFWVQQYRIYYRFVTCEQKEENLVFHLQLGGGPFIWLATDKVFQKRVWKEAVFLGDFTFL